MITLNNELPGLHKITLAEIDEGDFFEYESHIYQCLAWDEQAGYFNCLIPGAKEYVSFDGDTVVRPVDVEITVTGYTKG